jgi:hypothetical protein
VDVGTKHYKGDWMAGLVLESREIKSCAIHATSREKSTTFDDSLGTTWCQNAQAMGTCFRLANAL